MSENERKILLNRVRCPDGTVLTSWHRHDFKCHGDICVDGGTDYLRRCGTGYEELSEYYWPGDHKHNREYFHWGTYGPDGDKPLKYIALKDMTTDHIRAIIDTQPHIVGTHIEYLLWAELGWRDQ